MSRTKTNTAAVVLGVAILVFLATTLAFAGETSSTSAIAAGATEHATHRSVTRTVRCDRGHKLNRALSRAKTWHNDSRARALSRVGGPYHG